MTDGWPVWGSARGRSTYLHYSRRSSGRTLCNTPAAIRAAAVARERVLPT